VLDYVRNIVFINRLLQSELIPLDCYNFLVLQVLGIFQNYILHFGFLLLRRGLRTLIMQYCLEFRSEFLVRAIFTEYTVPSINPKWFISLHHLSKVLLLIWSGRLIFWEHLALIICSPNLSFFHLAILFYRSIEHLWIKKTVFNLKRRKLLML